MYKKTEEQRNQQIVTIPRGKILSRYYYILFFMLTYTNPCRDFQDAIKSFTKPRQTSDDEEEKLRTSAMSASATLSTLLIPSLKEVGTHIAFITCNFVLFYLLYEQRKKRLCHTTHT